MNNKQLNALKKHLSQRPMPEILDYLFGKGTWHFDTQEDLYIIVDPKYHGRGFGFIAMKPNGDWFRGVVPQGCWQ